MIQPDKDCARCPLYKGRTNLVLPSGDLSAKVVLVGEAPGENEDLSGKPFVGRAGKILDGILQDVGIERDKIMITNTVKCRPPDNRDPTKEEMAACRMYLNSELENRSVVVGLGRSAIRDLIGYEGPMADIVNKMQKMTINGKEIDFLPTYHPMACVYRKSAREGLKNTMLMLKDMIG